MVTYAMQARRYSQYEPSSGSLDLSARYNCGPTCCTFWGSFYRNGTYLYIESTRTGTGIPRGRSTTFDEQRRMLAYRGIGASVRQITSMTALDGLIGDGRRAIVLPLLMSRIPASVRGHAFLGWHSVSVMQKSNDGYWIQDPNFPPGSASLARFYPKATLAWAMFGTGASTAYAIVAYDPKPLPATPSDPVIRGKIQVNSTVSYVNLRATPGGTIIGSARGPVGVAGAGIYRGSTYSFPLNSTFNYMGSDATGAWRKMGDYANRYYWIAREFTHLVT